MYWRARLFAVAVMVIALVLPSLGQERKKNAVNPDADKKADAEPGDKKAEKKSARGKPKEDVPPEEKVVYGQMLPGKLKQIDPESQKDFTVEILLPDPVKVMEVEVWKTQQMLSISRQTNPFTRQQQMVNYQTQLAQKNVTTPRDLPVRAAEDIKVRLANPPTEYDDKGNLKKRTAKELKALRGNTKLPGYPAEYDALRPGQLVQIYLATAAVNTKVSKKAPPVKLDPTSPENRPKVVMIVIMQDVPPGQR